MRCVRVTCAGGGGSSSSFGSSANTPKLAPCASMPNPQPLRALARRMPCGAAACSPTRALRLGRRKREWGLSGNGAFVGMGLRSQPRRSPSRQLRRLGVPDQVVSDRRFSLCQLAAPRRRRNTLQHVATRCKSAVWSGKPKIRGAAARSSVRQYVQNHNMLYFQYGRMQRTCAPPHTRASARMHARTRNQQCARARSLAHARARSRMSSRLGLPLRTPVSWIRFDSAAVSVAQIRELPAKVGRAMRARAAADSVRRSAGKARRGPRAP